MLVLLNIYQDYQTHFKILNRGTTHYKEGGQICYVHIHTMSQNNTSVVQSFSPPPLTHTQKCTHLFTRSSHTHLSTHPFIHTFLVPLGSYVYASVHGRNRQAYACDVHSRTYTHVHTIRDCSLCVCLFVCVL